VIHGGLLNRDGARWLWWTLALLAACAALYATQRATTPPNGGTWQGYVLGTLGALLILWLALLGIRKRRYGAGWGSTAAWTSAHVYLGSALLVIATLHSAAQLGWNVHSLAYLLVWIVVLSGMFGTWAYLVLPRRLAALRGGGTRSDLFAQLLGIDRQVRELADRAGGTDIATAMISAVERTSIGGGVLAQLFSRDASTYLPREGAAPEPNADQRALIAQLANRAPRADKRQEAALLQEALVLASRRQSLLRMIRGDIRLQGWLRAWLYLHVPVTLALLLALAIHVLSTFFYW
jgi:hypothetical protein